MNSQQRGNLDIKADPPKIEGPRSLTHSRWSPFHPHVMSAGFTPTTPVIIYLCYTSLEYITSRCPLYSHQHTSLSHA